MSLRNCLPVAALLVTAAAPPGSGTLTILVENVRVSRGRVHVDVCPEGKFLKNGCPYTASAIARKGETVVVVSNLPAGRFAIQAYLDENSNDKMDFNMFGLPKEQFGFSRDFKGMRAPKFEEAAFNATGTAQSMTLRLHSAL